MFEDINHTIEYWVNWVVRRNDRVKGATPCVIEVGTRANGVYITLPNGIKVSIQWGTGNYCDRRDESINWWNQDYHDPKGSRTAEVAMWNKYDEWYQLSDSVKRPGPPPAVGHRTVAHVHGLLDRALRSEDFAPLWDV
jgi:hypothetical protein|tara:strand:+ start:810 stop:1223 length:414 start_codon:yes stop_codon:yes gene_type:complete